MSRKTINKFCGFVILILISCSACSLVSSSADVVGSGKNSNASEKSNDYGEPRIVGAISSSEITESSGIAASKCQPDVFWTHNDSGDGAFIFALSATGASLGTYKIAGAKNYDWEDIAAFKDAKTGECFLYVGDIGNNERLKGEMTIYRVKEPTVAGADKSSNRKNPVEIERAEAIKFVYPDIRHDAETLLVHPQTGDIYVLSKSLSHSSGVYKLAAANVDLNKTNTLEKVADFSVPAVPDGFLTGGDISPDGRRVVICDYFNAYEIALPADAKSFDDIWKQTPKIINLGARKQGEGVSYSADGSAIYATSEGRNSPLIEVKRK